MRFETNALHSCIENIIEKNNNAVIKRLISNLVCMTCFCMTCFCDNCRQVHSQSKD